MPRLYEYEPLILRMLSQINDQSPNPRLQRTRMRAPLSRKPLGATSVSVAEC